MAEDEMDVDVEPKAKSKKEGGKDSSKPRFEVKKVCLRDVFCMSCQSEVLIVVCSPCSGTP